MSLPLTKLANIQSDLSLLQDELDLVNICFHRGDPQHESRKWEYAMALRAIGQWEETHVGNWHLVDVGGAGSPFYTMVGPAPSCASWKVIDPAWKDGQPLEGYCRAGAPLVDVVTCLSVLEHVDDLDHFCYLLGCLVAPGGLLFLTMDHGTDLPDEYHFHWDRKRIFDTKAWETLREKFGEFTLFGGRDRTYHGNQVYDFSIASLAMVKRA